MVAIHELVLPLFEDDQEKDGAPEKVVEVPEQKLIVRYVNGIRGEVEETIVGPLEDSEIYSQIFSELRHLKSKWDTLDGQIKRLLKKKPHGRSRPQREITKLKVPLNQQKEQIVGEIDLRKGTIDQLKRHLETSNPSEPLLVAVDRVTVEIIKGEPMSEAGQRWWKFMREETPGIWGLYEEETGNYQLLRGLFEARYDDSLAIGLSRQERDEAGGKRKRIEGILGRMPESEFNLLKPFVGQITGYFKKPVFNS